MATQIVQYLGQGLAAARPATPAIGTGAIGLYFATDTNALSIYANSVWQGAAGGALQTAAPLSANFSTIINGHTGSPAPAVVDKPQGMLFTSGPTYNGDAMRAAMKSIISASTFTIVMGMRITMASVNYRTCGLVITDGTKFYQLCLQHNSGLTIQVIRMTNLTTFSASEYSVQPFGAMPGEIYFKIQGDGTNLIFSYSFDGYNFLEVFHEALGAYLSTITEWGVGGDANGSTALTVADAISALVFYASETNP